MDFDASLSFPGEGPWIWTWAPIPASTIPVSCLHCPHLAFSWIREEPPTHLTALPWQILAAILTISLTWGWIRVAGAVALCWGGLARVGEVTSAERKDLVLPEYVGEHGLVVYLFVTEPKTRFRAASHQSLQVDHPQLVRLIKAAYKNLAEGDFLWHMSPATLRSRFAKLLGAISLTPGLVPGVKDVDLGSLRAGGATWLMLMLDDPEKVRRRGLGHKQSDGGVRARGLLAPIPPEAP